MQRRFQCGLSLLLVLVSSGAGAQPATTPGGNGPSEKQLEEMLEAVKADPGDADAQFNLGLVYQLQEKPELAAPHFEAALKANPEDWHAVAKLVQVNQALNLLPARDAWREKLLAMYRAGKVVNPKMDSYVRDQFRFDKYWVAVLEFFELTGPRAVRYSFEVLASPQKPDALRVISLGSYDFDQPLAHSSGTIGPNDRLFHLDGYWPDGSHATYAFYKNEPGYDGIRKYVLAILGNEPGTAPRSTTTPHLTTTPH
jgi:tetratricopeptide (TPR) repeat protein